MKTLTYEVQSNPSYLGRYFLPGTFCEAMYDIRSVQVLVEVVCSKAPRDISAQEIN